MTTIAQKKWIKFTSVFKDKQLEMMNGKDK
jgi:hypothetical protein